jgi:hypothetical protein
VFAKIGNGGTRRGIGNVRNSPAEIRRGLNLLLDSSQVNIVSGRKLHQLSSVS